MASRTLRAGIHRAQPRPSRRRAARKPITSFLPALVLMEDRTLLATMLWAQAAGGDWGTSSNWVNANDGSDHHVPTAADDAVINFSGITVTHAGSSSDSVNSINSQAAIAVTGGTLAIAGVPTSD